ncbi:MAG: hypothetical protein ACYC40_02260 [Patescibacteria group bacterium]
MFPEQLKKILQLIKTTGDRVIVFDPSTPDDSYVILDFDRYSKMINDVKVKGELIKTQESVKLRKEAIKEIEDSLNKLDELDKNLAKDSLKQEDLVVKEPVKSENLTEDDLTDKINREISMWKNRDDVVYLEEGDKPKKAWQIPPQVKNNAQIIE